MTKKNGFTLVELMVGTALFVMIGLSIWQGYHYVSELVRVSKTKTIAIALANEQIEIVRNLPYSDIGIQGGIPSGKLRRLTRLTRGGITFDVKFTVRNIDDPSDTIFPIDKSPADYKLVEVEISCPTCRNFPAVRVTTTVAPKNLETTTNNGALFIRALDANGQPVKEANVHIENNQAFPPIVINDTTDINGWLQLVDVPPGVEAYEITVSKPGYSKEKTYQPGLPDNPNPVKPHATVVIQQVTQITFAIDKVSTLNVFSKNEYCSVQGYFNFSMRGAKLIGTNPDVYKYSENHTTDAYATCVISDIESNLLEWDNYSIFLTDESYDLAGSIPLIPFNLDPDTTLDLLLVVKPKLPKALLVVVKDAATQLPLSGASVRLEKTGYDETKITGRGYLHQTDWSGGPGQENFQDETRYWSQDGNIATNDPAGEIKLEKIDKGYQLNGWLVSSTFDTGEVSNFYKILWQPSDQPPKTEVKFQIATSPTDLSAADEWEYKGSAGTADTYYTLADTNIYSAFNKDRYLRYKVFLSTEDQLVTPNVSDIAVIFSSSCIPPGQAFFNKLSEDTYTLTVTLDGYQTHSEEINISDDWTKEEIVLNPE